MRAGGTCPRRAPDELGREARAIRACACGSTVGGARLTGSASDTAVALAIASATAGVPVGQRVVAIGELGLSGELRRVPDSTDVLGSYAVALDSSGELEGYQRTRRYYRSQVEEG